MLLLAILLTVDDQTRQPWLDKLGAQNPRCHGHEDDVAYRGHQSPRKKVEQERVKDEVRQDRLRMIHEGAVEGEVLCCCGDAEEQDG